MSKLFSEFLFTGLLVFGILLRPVAPAAINPAINQPIAARAEDEVADILDRWLGRAAEYGIIGIVALWLLRVVIVDVRGDIKILTQKIMQISEKSQEGGNDIKRLSMEINTKLDRLLRDVERIEYTNQRRDNNQ